MTGQEAISYIQNVAYQGTRLGLVRIEELLELLGNPQKKLKFIHIAGTNGKGSTSAMLSSILINSGYKTGVFTSPVLTDFREQMTVNGEKISYKELGNLTQKVKEISEKMIDPPTEFEMVTAIAFLYFLDKNCDLVILEVGMGGRLDSTNVIDCPEVAVICNIGYDHMNMLGNTLEEIAKEKAGIIKNNGDVVIYQPDVKEVEDVFVKVCKDKNSNLHIADFSKLELIKDSIEGQDFNYKAFKQIHINLLGEHQRKNAAVVSEIVALLVKKGYNISDLAIKNGFSKAKWAGRFELLQKEPIFIADGGHNIQCAEAVLSALKEYFPNKKFIFIMGVLADKDYMSMIKLFKPIAKEFFTVTPNSPRALKAEELGCRLNELGCKAHICSNISVAVQKAFEVAEKEDIICSVGSLYITGEVRENVLKRNKN